MSPPNTLSDKLWNYLQAYETKHRAKGNGFGYGLADLDGVSRTLLQGWIGDPNPAGKKGYILSLYYCKQRRNDRWRVADFVFILVPFIIVLSS